MSPKNVSSIQAYQLTIAYDGTAYKGWQRQKNGLSVQECIETALNRLWKEGVVIHGSGRTDTGVHAQGQVAHFSAPKKFSKGTDLRNATNAHLPDDIRITTAALVSSDFHARFSAIGKTYQYRIRCGHVHDPMELNRSWQIRRPLDLDLIKTSAHDLIGTHDFASFASNPGYSRETTVRTIHQISISKSKGIITLRFKGSGFLYRMVRNLTGALVRVGDGRLEPKDIKHILNQKSRSSAPPPAPAHGLYLMKVHY